MSSARADNSSLKQRLLQFAERHLPSLTRLRVPEGLPIQLHRRRIYVVPTRFGFGFAVLIGIMLLGALNYGNNPALLLTCTLATAAWMSIFVGFRTLSGLEFSSVQAADCHAGGPLELHCEFAGGARNRPSLRLRWLSTERSFFVRAGESSRVTITLPTEQRGWLRPGRMKVWTEQPLGLFILWSWLNPEVEALIYPALENPTPPLPIGDGVEGNRQIAGEGSEQAGLRVYRAGDPQRRIAWKASARHDDLLVRETEHPYGEQLVLSYQALTSLPPEARIQRLAAWVVAAESAQLEYALQLPDQSIPAGLGDKHRHACLRALALMPHATH
jgi:uncharacterized protein (DUF58 family)